MAQSTPISTTNLPSGLLDATRVLYDLQQANEIAQSFSGCLEPEAIAHCMTTGLVDRFHGAFARVWLLESNQTMLRLVASSGMYTRTDGFFGRVPMGAYKVGKIAQNRVSFLSNNLPAEPWVGDREWAIANRIRGFAGYPLAIGNRVIGVLAMFSHEPLEPEFLEVLQTLCTIATITLDTAMQYQQEKQAWPTASPTARNLTLSDQLAEILSGSRLTLLGTEQPLSTSKSYVFLKTAESLNQLRCTHARLIYSDVAVTLEAIVPNSTSDATVQAHSTLAEVHTLAAGLGGILQTQPTSDQRALQITLNLPYTVERSRLRVQISCTSLLQLALTQLAITAGLALCDDQNAPLITDDLNAISGDRAIIWISQARPQPAGIRAKIDLSVQPEQLRQAVEAVTQGRTWGIQPAVLSDRELEILLLLTQGHRDRDIADRLVISESTVKFHLNNVLAKLKARTRYQAIYQAIEQGWI
ncbi:MAG TPA: LuxR C-terminal-related transcriptional regulator [Thermosynechococcaceae cyanobacterium]